MGSNKSALLSEDDVQIICQETGFTPKELQRLYARFQELEKKDPPLGYFTREELLNIREVAVNPLGERLIDVLLQDHGETNKINFRQFANIFALFRRDKAPTNLHKREKKLLFLFNLYDRNHDSNIDRSELIEILKLMVGGNVNDEQISTIADHTIGELDVDGDLKITFEEFCGTLSKIHIDEKMSMKFPS
ncbi:unnamed protein product [Rotaria socialis]|uniref:EF-hand domain-containing protein n=1 Tax=Rotaria socialis TaxID=392032 RepID=A0A817UKK2_9BILA|nr:unnamed protein product [Rotaria socialis]CAF4499808.1 unnamed protein product [Rotaria socialis]